LPPYPPPTIHSSPTMMALNVNECGSVSSHIFYQLFTHPPPPAFFCPDLTPHKQTSLSLRLRTSAVAVISSPTRSLLPGKSCFLKPGVDGLHIDRGAGVATATPMSRCPPICVCRSIWHRHCVWSLSLPRVAKAGGVTLATLMAPWRRDLDRSSFLRSGRCRGSYSLYVAEAWGGGGR
jgi:hypothetical protein